MPPVPLKYFFLPTEYQDSYKGRLSGFGLLDHLFCGHDVVFLNPIEVVSSLNLKVLSSGSRIGGFTIINNLKSEDDIRNVMKSDPLSVFVSDSLSVNVVDSIMFSKNREYIYGRLGRVVERISFNDLVKRSKLVWRNAKEYKEYVGVYLGQFLMRYYVRLPMFTYGLVLVEEGGWISSLSPEVLLYVSSKDVKEFRVFTIFDLEIPVVVVRRLKRWMFVDDETDAGFRLSWYIYYLYGQNVEGVEDEVQ